MAEIDEKIDLLQSKVENLLKYQEYFQSEISQIRYEINVLRAVQQKRQNLSEQTTPAGAAHTGPGPKKKPPVREYVPPPRSAETASPPDESAGEQTGGDAQPPPNVLNFTPPADRSSADQSTSSARQSYTFHSTDKSNLEKFIGENLISKVGIVILVLGVAIGAKYAIDNNLISPLMRIVLGYAFGFGLLGFAVKLKSKYHNFSAVLLSGAMAIMYFITYAAHSYYSLFSQTTAFVLMLMFTVFTVVSALHYNRQIIAHVGLVGAYAIPFLLSDDSGNYAFLFTYMAIINGGILAVSLKKYWKPLFYTSFIFTWAAFSGWYFSEYQTAEHFSLALTFLTIFFLTFYVTFIGYKLISKENVAIENVALLLANSFVFYGLGYNLLSGHADFSGYLGMFTVANAAIHFAFAVTVSRMNVFPDDLLYLLAALVLTFATIAVPVQLDGNFVTLIWTAEAAILFWIGRTRQIRLYESFSFPLMVLASVSLLTDWHMVSFYRSPTEITAGQYPVLNGNFFTGLFFAAACGFIYRINKDENFEPVVDDAFRLPLGYLFAAVGLCLLYNVFRLEIVNYFHYQMVRTAAPGDGAGRRLQVADRNLSLFSTIWQINYTMLYLTVLSFLNIKRFKNVVLLFANLALNAFVLVLFLTAGLYVLAELRESYLLQSYAEFFDRGVYLILIRYVSYVFVAGLILASYFYTKAEFVAELAPPGALAVAFDVFFYVSLLFIASSELLNLMDLQGYHDSHKLGLSVLWGIYALFLVVLGISQHKKHLRIGAILLFGVTLLKLFLYDIAGLDTISKTVVFVSLGISMLVVSFLYHKYKHLIFDANEA